MFNFPDWCSVPGPTAEEKVLLYQQQVRLTTSVKRKWKVNVGPVEFSKLLFPPQSHCRARALPAAAVTGQADGAGGRQDLSRLVFGIWNQVLGSVFCILEIVFGIQESVFGEGPAAAMTGQADSGFQQQKRASRLSRAVGIKVICSRVEAGTGCNQVDL